MKKIILILDGMADRKQAKLGGKTPLEYANMPNLDALFAKSISGCVQTIPDGEEVGSAVANLNLLGFESKKVYKGRAVIEAAGAKIKIDKNSLYVRTNFITLKGSTYADSIIESYSAHEIKTQDALPLTKQLNDELFTDGYELINTGSFRHVLVCKNQTNLFGKLMFAPPHDMIGKPINIAITDDAINKPFFALQEKAHTILSKASNTKANGIWFWGVSVCPDLSEQNEDKKAILSETILMKGIANLMGAHIHSTSEQNGFIAFLQDKAKAAVETIKADYDFIYVHIQAPDDLSHELLPVEKADALSQIDAYFLGDFLDGIKDMDYTLVVASDHYTFSDDGSHGSEPTPFILHHSTTPVANAFAAFNEANCMASNLVLSPAQLHDRLK